jgi:SAM-dependent methyltransferase
LPFKTDCADITTSFEVIEHLPDPKASVREIQRTAKSFVAVSVPMIGTPLFGLDQGRFDRFAESVEMKIRSFLDRVGWENGLRVLEKRTGAAHVNIFTYSRFSRLFSFKHSYHKARGALFYFPRLDSILENPVTRRLYLVLESILLSRLPIFVVRVSWLPFKPLGNRYGIIVFCRVKT